MSEAKEALRQQVLALRRAQPAEERARRSALAQQHLAELAPFQSARTLALYRPLRSEADTAQLAVLAHEAGKRVCYPRLSADGQGLTFLATEPGAAWARDALGFEFPQDGQAVELAALELVVLPGVAFDARGGRLGLGRGFYDRALATRPAGLVSVGLGFGFQLVEAVPTEPHDARLDWVVTDAGARFCR